jgi:hypothetical protein
MQKKGESKDKLENIKSKFRLNQIFDCLKRNRFLEIIKYNKMIQKRLDLGLEKYKEYCEIFSSIKIELIPINFH